MPIPPLLPLLVVATSEAATFAELADATRTSSTTAKIVALDEKTGKAGVGAAVSRVVPGLSLSDNLTRVWLNTERFPQPGESLEECEERLGRACESLLALADGFSVPGEAVNHTLSLVATQPVWNGRAVIGITQATTRLHLGQTQGRIRLDDEAGELVRSYVELQAAVETLRLTRAALAIAEQELAATKTSRSVGAATDLDVELAAFEVTSLKKDLQQVERLVPRALGELWDTAGRSSESTQRVCPLMDVTDRGAPIDLGAAPSLELSRQKVRLDKQDRTIAQLSFLPNVTAVAGVSYTGRGEDLSASLDDFGQNYWYVGGTASWTLFSGGSRYFDNRSASWTVQKSVLELEQGARDLALDDADHAARLRDLSEDLDTQAQELVLKRRVLAVTETSYRDGGRTTLDQVLQARRVVTQLEAEIVATQKEQVWTLTRRWVRAGRADELLAALTRSDEGHAAAGRCTDLSR